MRHTLHTRRLSMASVDNSIGGAAGDASSGQEPIDVEPGSSPSPMDNEVRHFVFAFLGSTGALTQSILLHSARVTVQSSVTCWRPGVSTYTVLPAETACCPRVS